MVTLLGIDFETTSLKPGEGVIVEAATVLWDTEFNAMVSARSTLFRNEHPGPYPNDIAHMTGISPLMLDAHGHANPSNYFRNLAQANSFDFIVAHNADFERRWLNYYLPRDMEFTKPWLDTMTDIPYPPKYGEGNLVSIAAMHQVPILKPHRALNDVLMMMGILAQYDIDAVIKRSITPKIKLALKFPYDPTKVLNGKAKTLGYRWNGDAKHWENEVLESEYEAHYQDCLELDMQPVVLEREEEIMPQQIPLCG